MLSDMPHLTGNAVAGLQDAHGGTPTSDLAAMLARADVDAVAICTARYHTGDIIYRYRDIYTQCVYVCIYV
jgi:hypothetical protein